MKVLNVCDCEGWDIVAYQALHMAASLARKGHSAAVLCHKGSRLYAECAKLKVTAVPMTLGTRVGMGVGSWDIIHLYDPLAIPPPIILKKIKGKARLFFSRYRMGCAKSLARLADVSPYVNMYLGGCNSVQEDFFSLGIAPGRTFMLPPAINIGRWESAMLIKKTMAPKPPFKVGTVTMDRTLKEQELFLMMAKEVLLMLPDTHFMLVGIKDEGIRKLARGLDISHKVDILSDRTDMPEVMAMMNIYAKTSLREGLSMSLIEAQASGVPCVLPRQRGLSDFTVNERNGLVVNPGDILGCARAVIRLIGDQQACHNLSNMAYNYVNNNMSAPVTANILARLYEDNLSS